MKQSEENNVDEDADSDDCMIVEDSKPQITSPNLQPQIPSQNFQANESPPSPPKITSSNLQALESLLCPSKKSAIKPSTSLLYKCQFCTDFPSLAFDKLIAHTKNYHSYRCEYCKKVYSNSVSLNSHILNEHDIEKIYSCEVCKEEFLDRFILEDHHQLKHKKKLFKCENSKCTFYFDSPANLRAHMLLTHPPNIVVAKNIVVRKIKSLSKALASAKSWKLNKNIKLDKNIKLTSIPKSKSPQFMIEEVTLQTDENNPVKFENIKEENMESQEIVKTVSLEEVTIVENATIKMESEDQDEIQFEESKNVMDEEEEEINMDEEMPIQLNEKFNLPSTFASTINTNVDDDLNIDEDDNDEESTLR